MILRLCGRNIFLHGNNISQRLPTSHQLRNGIERLSKCFKIGNEVKRLRFLRAFRLTGAFAGTGFCLVRQAHCKSGTARANPLVFKETQCKLKWSDFWKLIRPCFHWLLIASLGALVVALLNIQIPMLLGKMVNIIAEFLSRDAPPDFSRLTPIGGQLLTLYVGQCWITGGASGGGLDILKTLGGGGTTNMAFFTFLYITCLSIMGERVAADLRVKLFGHLLHFDMAFFDQQMTGELSDRLNFDVQEFKSSFKACIAQGLRTTTQTAGCIVSLHLMSPKMTFLTVAVIPVVVLVGSAFGAVLRRISNAAQAQSSFAMGIANEAFSNIRTVKEFAMEDAEQILYKGEVEKARILNEELGVGIGIFQAATNIFLNGIVLGTLYGGAHLIADSNISPGDLMSFLVTSQTIQRSLTQLSLVFGNAVKGYTSCTRIYEFLKREPSNISGSAIIPANRLTGSVRLEDVTFAYPTRSDHAVILRFSLDIERGKTIALCGTSGSGKSTIAALIERLYEPQGGRITLDDVDLSVIDPYWLRKRAIGVISQEPVLFATSIAENIRYGKIEATDEEVREAARLANADGFITQFPNGYSTMVGERGVALSGGQKQRIAIARALLKNPPILIFDEATSALDAESERTVQEALEKVAKNRTVIIIAHRLSTIRNADLICVVGNGKLLEQGTHAQLLRKKGAYYTLVNLQQSQNGEVLL